MSWNGNVYKTKCIEIEISWKRNVCKLENEISIKQNSCATKCAERKYSTEIGVFTF